MEKGTGGPALGYFTVATGIVVPAIVVVATQLRHHACQTELARQRQEATQASSNALLRSG